MYNYGFHFVLNNDMGNISIHMLTTPVRDISLQNLSDLGQLNSLYLYDFLLVYSNHIVHCLTCLTVIHVIATLKIILIHVSLNYYINH